MQTCRIGSLEVSVAGLGCNNFGWRIDEAGTARVVDAALDSGMNFFDTADIYGRGESEEHQPDPSTPINDTLGALDDLVKAGKVREIGCSNFSAEQIQEAEEAVRPGAARFVSVQNHYSMLHRDPENGVLQECERRGIAFIPYFPLANGLLTGKYRRGQAPPVDSRATAGFGPKVFTEENLQLVETLIDFAASRGHSLLELAFGWLLARRPVASVIAGARTPEQVRANAEAVSWTVSPEDMAEIDRLLPETWSRTA
jgi:aryl-alcohol dehydrogenase-like predicted oxidoreductase